MNVQKEILAIENDQIFKYTTSILLFSHNQYSIDGVTKSDWTCVREDGRDLTEEWKEMKRKEGVKHAYVSNKEELRSINPRNVDHLLGIIRKYFKDLKYFNCNFLTHDVYSLYIIRR